VTVDLRDDPPAGEPGEGDVVRRVESLTGGRGPDRLAGDEHRNQLRGGRSADVLIGRRGGDELFGGRSRDRLEGGPGGDVLRPGRALDSLSCGLGRDSVDRPTAGEVIGRCESVFYDHLFGGGELEFIEFPPHPVHTSRRAITFRIPCPEFDEDDGEFRQCAGKLTVRKAFGRHSLLGRTHVLETRRDAADIRVPLTRRARALIRRPQGVLATASLRGGNLPAVDWTIRLRR